MRTLAKIIARVFDPVVLVPLILVGVASMAYLNGYRWRFLTLLFFLDAVVPGLVFLYLWGKKGFKDWDFRARGERLPLFGATVLMHGVGVMVAYLIDRHPLAEILLTLWLVAVVYTLVTFRFKISVHAGVNATLATLMYWLVGPEYWWVFALPLVVSWARVKDEDHKVIEVVVGTVVAPLIITGMFWGLGVI